MSSSPLALTLTSAQLRCVLRPDLGGSIQSLDWLALAGDVPVLRTPPAQMHTVRDMGSFPLAPFSNRVAKARLQWQGTDHPLVRMGTTEEHAMHGIVWQRPWQVLEASDSFAMLSYEHTADIHTAKLWPFAFDVSQVFKLEGSTLSMMISLTNQAPGPAPVGLGWHPYFAKRAGAQISFAASARWEMGENKLPTHAVPATGLNVVCDHLDIDHCFDGWAGVAHLRDDLLCTRIESSLAHLVVYTHPSIHSVAIEPVSHVNNAMNLAAKSADEFAQLGIRILASGETLTAQMSITVEAT